MSKKVTESVSWVGKVDWELERFHGEEYITRKGSSYNAYLVRDEKTALIDTVWIPYAREFVDRLRQEISLEKIDYVIANHGEIDHSGSLPELMRLIPDTPIYCTANGVKSLRGQYHQDWNFQVVKTGDRLSLGSRELIFIEAPMLHWPDTMFSYLTGENILFSNDGFGQHYASEFLFNDLVDQGELYTEAVKYYANILNPFSKQVERKIEELLGLNLPIDMICPSHGVIWRDHPTQIVEQYLKWSRAYQENQVTILYDTMWESTRKMAEAIARGITQAAPDVTVKLFHTAKRDKTGIMAEVFKSKAVLVGSPTINRGILSSVAATLEEMRGLGFKSKKASAFGSYGWSGESVKMILQGLKAGGFELTDEGLRATWNPGEEDVAACEEFGRKFAQTL